MAKSIEEKIEDHAKAELKKLNLKYYTKTEIINESIDEALNKAPNKKGGDGVNRHKRTKIHQIQICFCHFFDFYFGFFGAYFKKLVLKIGKNSLGILVFLLFWGLGGIFLKYFF